MEPLIPGILDQREKGARVDQPGSAVSSVSGWGGGR